MANLLVEVGNTALKAAWAEGMTLGKAFRFQGEKVMEFILSLTEKEKPEVMAVVSGIMFEIEGYIRRHPGHVVVFTGGDAAYFAKRMKQSLFIVSNLVQVGLALITDDYVEKNIQ